MVVAWWSIIPFVLLLGCIAVLPLIPATEKIWDRSLVKLIVANCGGLLTPLGDPPLFLGMLRGVPFDWTFGLLPYWVFVNALLLISCFALDSKMYAKEPAEALAKDAEYATKLGLRAAKAVKAERIVVPGTSESRRSNVVKL